MLLLCTGPLQLLAEATRAADVPCICGGRAGCRGECEKELLDSATSCRC